ncbi:MAG: hypothetical protein NT007_16880 [Candidatus Kapabacteria bacterium]|nr:hypothetical protein [Candidatus Kapabacteria bacterium]
MKKQTIQLLLALIVAFIGFYSCSNQSQISNPVPANTTSTIQTDALGGQLNEATLENDMQYTPTAVETGIQTDPQIIPLDRILKQLNLTEEQTAKIKGLLGRYRECAAGAIRELRASEREIMQHANEARRAIIEKFKKGEITREEAAAAMERLNQRVREALQNNPAKAAAKAAIKNCLDRVFAAIDSVLEGDQIRQWRAWVINFWKNFR